MQPKMYFNNTNFELWNLKFAPRIVKNVEITYSTVAHVFKQVWQQQSNVIEANIAAPPKNLVIFLLKNSTCEWLTPCWTKERFIIIYILASMSKLTHWPLQDVLVIS